MTYRDYWYRTNGPLWDRSHRALWRSLGQDMSLLYWVLVGHWLVPLAFATLWGFFALYGFAALVRSTWLVIRPRFVRRGVLSPLPPVEARDPAYPWLRVGSEVRHVTHDRVLSAGQIRRGPKSGPLRDWKDAEERAASWMRHWGWLDAGVTQSGADGGIDVAASGAVAQVKYWAKAVPRPDLQNLVGAASTMPHVRRMLFFSSGGYTTEARAWADSAGVAIFWFDEGGNPQPQNNLAARIATGGAESKTLL